MRTQLLAAAFAALITLTAAAPPLNQAHKTARLRLTTEDGRKIEQLVHTGGEGNGQGERVTKNRYPDEFIKQVEILGIDGKYPEYVLCSCYSADGELIGPQNESSFAWRSVDGRLNDPAKFLPAAQVDLFECLNWWGD